MNGTGGVCAALNARAGASPEISPDKPLSLIRTALQSVLAPQAPVPSAKLFEESKSANPPRLQVCDRFDKNLALFNGEAASLGDFVFLECMI
jgi:hypothetical protein